MSPVLDDTPLPFADQLEEVLLSYMKAREAGQPVDREALMAAHPALAESLQAYFADEDSLVLLLTPKTPLTPAEKTTALGSVGEYELLAEISRGGMGVVYRARQPRLKRDVALKVIREGRFAGPAERARFRTEVESAAQLDHPNIVPIYEVGDQGEQPFFSMKLIEGGSLEDQVKALAASGVDGQRRAAALVAKLARAVHHAHQRGILHRDLKPRNILLDAAGEPLVTDFGLAKRLGVPGQTDSGAIMGTPEYMAPEQARGEKGLTTAVDVHGLGGIFYALLTGEPPFHGETVAEALRHVMDQEPLAPRKRKPGVNCDLETICLKCLAKEPTKRYATALELAEDLERFQAGEPILARPVGTVERALKWMKRRPALAALIAVSALALASLLGGGIYFTLGLEARNEDLAQQVVLTKKAEAAARADKEQALAVAKLLESAFLGLDPMQGPAGGFDLKTQLLTSLEQMAVELETKYRGDPHVRAALRNALGIAEQGLGEPEKAILLFQAAREEYEKLGGRDHPDTLLSMNNLAGAYQAAGKLDLALRLFKQTLQKRKATLDADHPDTLASMNNLAGAHQADGRHDLALPLLKLTLEKRRATLSPDHPDLLDSMNNLASAYRYTGKLSQALPLYVLVVEQRKIKPGPDHPQTLTNINNLADAYQAAGDHTSALRLFKEVLDKRKEKLPPDHPHTLGSMNNLAGAYQVSGDLTSAIRWFKETLNKRKVKLVPDHPDTLASMNNLAWAYQAARRLNEALPLFKETLQRRKATLAPDHPDMLLSMNNLAGAYLLTGKPELAVPLFADVLEKRRPRFAPDHPELLGVMGNLIETYLAAKQPAQAIPLLHEFLVVQRKRLGADDPRLARVLAAIGQDLLKYDQPAEAEKLLRECRMIRETKEPEAWTTFHTRSLLGGALLGQKKTAEAESLLREGYEGMKSREKYIPPAGRHHLTNAVQRLVQLYEATDRPEQAAEWREKLPAAKKGSPP